MDYKLMQDNDNSDISGGQSQTALCEAKQRARQADAEAGVKQLSEAEFQRLCDEEATAYAQNREATLAPHHRFYTIDSEADRVRVLSTYVQRTHPLLRVCFGSTRPLAAGPGGSLVILSGVASCRRSFAEGLLSALPRAGTLFVHVFCGLFIVLYAAAIFACDSASTVFIGSLVAHILLAGIMEGAFAVLFDTAAKFSKRFGRDTIDKKASPLQQAKGYVIFYAGTFGMQAIAIGMLIGLVTLSLNAVLSAAMHPCTNGKDPQFSIVIPAFLTSILKSFATQPAYASILVANFPEYALKELNTNHRKNSIHEEASDLLNDFNPDATSTTNPKASRTLLQNVKQKLFGYDKVVQGGGVAYPAPLKAKLLAIFLGMPALLFDSPMYAGWDMDERYSTSFLGALVSDYLSIFGQMYCCCCACCCSSKNKKAKRPTFVKGADAVLELPIKRQFRVKALFRILKHKSEKLVQTFGDATIPVAIENEIFLASGSDEDEYAKRMLCVEFWLTDKDAGEQRCLQTRLGVIEPSAVVKVVDTLGLRKLAVLHLIDVAGDEGIASALEHEIFLVGDSCEGAKYLKCIKQVQNWLEVTGYMTFAGFTDGAARELLAKERISKLKSKSVDPATVVRKLAPAERTAVATEKASKSRRSKFYRLAEVAVLALLYLLVVKPMFAGTFACEGEESKAECDAYPTKCVWDKTLGMCEECGTGQFQMPCKKAAGFP